LSITQACRPVQPSRQECVGLCRATHLAQECDPCAAHAFTGGESHLKAEAVAGGHRRVLSFDAGMPPREQDEGIPVIGVHVREESGQRIGQRVRMRKKP